MISAKHALVVVQNCKMPPLGHVIKKKRSFQWNRVLFAIENASYLHQVRISVKISFGSNPSGIDDGYALETYFGTVIPPIIVYKAKEKLSSLKS